MADRPILFSGPMVRALLAGTKTQTRRLVPLQTGEIVDEGAIRDGVQERRPVFDKVADTVVGTTVALIKPAARPGDVFWVRETLRRAPDIWTYEADGTEVGWPARGELAGKKRDHVVSIHMPRAASRILLPVLDVRVERLEVITETDAIAEGMHPAAVYGGRVESWLPAPDMRETFYPTARQAYVALWEHLNGRDSWAKNPLVWVYTFGPAEVRR